MRRAASVLLVMALLVPACASTTPSQTPHASSPPRTEVAASYLDLVTTSNAATCDFNAVLSQSAPTLADLTRASAQYAASLAELIDGLRAIPWPEAFTEDANSLIDALVANETHTRAMADADTLETFIAAGNDLIAANGFSSTAATQLRNDLGLGSGGDPCTT